MMLAGTLLAGRITAQCNVVADQDAFSNPAAWTIVDANCRNGSVQVNGGQLKFGNLETGTCAQCTSNRGVCNGREVRTHRGLNNGGPFTLSNHAWRAESVFRITDGNGPAHTLMAFTSGTQDPQMTRSGCPTWVCNGNALDCSGATTTNQDGIFASIVAFGNNQRPNGYNDQTWGTIDNLSGGVQNHDALNPTTTTNPQHMGWRIYGHAKNDAGLFYPATPIAACNTSSPNFNFSRGIELPELNKDYYMRLERLNAGTCQISIFSDAAMTVHVPGSPQCFYIDANIKNLNTFQNSAHPSGSFFRSLTGFVDNLVIYNNCPAVPDLVVTSSATGAVCAGSQVTLTASPGFSSYTWVGMPGGPIVTTSNVINVTPTTTTTYTVYGTAAGVYCPIMATVNVQVSTTTYFSFNPDFSLAVFSPTGNVGYFTAAARPIVGSRNWDIVTKGPGYGYAWFIETISSSGVSTTVANNPSNWWVAIPTTGPFSFSATLQDNKFAGFNGTSVNTSAPYFGAPGQFPLGVMYRITRGVWNPCTYTSKSKIVYMCEDCKQDDGKPVIIVKDDDSGEFEWPLDEATMRQIEASYGADVAVYPNPTSGVFTVEAAAYIEHAHIEVFDMLGNVLYSKDYDSMQSEQIDISALPAGIYYVHVFGSGMNSFQKLVKE